jgi:GNAT superfamily N-acetyltransferase
MRVRVATAADIPLMHRLRMSVRENRLANPASVQPADYTGRLTSGRGWVCELDDEVVGFAVADQVTASVWALFVHPAYEGRGVGRALHAEVVRWLFARGLDRIRLSTETGTRAERFYTALGWTAVGRQANGELLFELTPGDLTESPPA